MQLKAIEWIGSSKVVFVLHIFQKKSKQGIATPKREIDTLKGRLKMAEEMYNKTYKK